MLNRSQTLNHLGSFILSYYNDKNTLYHLALLQGKNQNISPSGVCLADFKRLWVKTKNTNSDLFLLRKKGYLWVTSVSYPRGLRRYYYTLTTKGKAKLWLPLTPRERFYLKFL